MLYCHRRHGAPQGRGHRKRAAYTMVVFSVQPLMRRGGAYQGLDVNGRKPTREEERWLLLCQQVPCIVCAEFHGVPDTPAEIHHIDGQRKPGAHLRTLSLCTRHHRHKDNHTPPMWVSRHGDGRAAFENRYASEWELYELQQRAVAHMAANYV